MKKFLYTFTFILFAFVAYSQKGISYQALIVDPSTIELPAEDINERPLINEEVWLKFGIYGGTTLQFEEIQKTKTDNYGLVNLLIGSVEQTAFNNLVWDANQKSLQVFVSFNQGASYTKISDQKLTYTPYALYAESAGKFTGIIAIENGGTGATTAASARTNLGLDKVDNTPDSQKPVSTAMQAYVAAQIATVNTATIVDANATTKGKIQLAGDLAGTADAPTVPGLALKANTADVAAALASKADTAEIKAYVNSQLATGLPLTTGVTGVLPVSKGGSGQSTYTDGQLLIGNSVGNTISKATLTAGSGISITNGNGSITIASTGGGSSSGTLSGTTNSLPKYINNTTLGNSLISDNGTGVGIGTTTPSGLLQIYGAGSEAPDQVEGTLSNNNLVVTLTPPVSPLGFLGTSLWQSFTAGITGSLTKISLLGGGNNMTLKIYSGVGTGGTLLFTSAPMTIVGTVPGVIPTFSFSIGSVNVVAGSRYTFEVSAPSQFGIFGVYTKTKTTESAFVGPTFGSLNSSPRGLSYATYVGTSDKNLVFNGDLSVGAVTYPSAHGTAGQVLTSVGSGKLSWTAGGTSISVGTITNTSNANGATFTGGVLSLTPADASNGGIVSTGTQSFAGNKTILGTLNVSTLSAGETTDVSTYTSTISISRSATSGSTQWQSFRAGTSGALTKITIYGNGNYAARGGTLSIYAGTGNTGTLLLTQSVNLPTAGGVAFDLVLNSPVNVTAGQAYTFQLFDIASGSGSPSSYITADRLSGASYYSSTWGLNPVLSGFNAGFMFKTWVGSSSGGSLTTVGTITAGTVTYPSAHGTAGQVLTSTGSGTLTFTTVSGGGTSISVGTITSTSNANGATLSGGVLSLTPADATNSGVVSTGTQSFAGNKTILGTLNVSTFNSGEAMDINNFVGVSATIGATHWQSFTAGVSGSLSKITVYGNSSAAARNGTFRIYAGTGNSGTQLSTQSVALPTNSGAWDLVLTSPLTISGGQVYTFEILDPLGNSASYGVANRIAGSSYYTNAYGLNYSSGGVNFGLQFKTWVASASGGSIVTAGNITAGTVTYPITHGTSGQVLTTTGSGTLTFTTISGVSSGAHYVGEPFGGGIVFYVYDDGKHGLIGATEDQDQEVKWEAFEFQVLNAVRDGINSGALNTERIIAARGSRFYAAQLCANYMGGGFGDWYLPSKYELNLLWLQREYFALYPFQESYWSSTEDTTDVDTTNDSKFNAWAQDFLNGNQSSISKSSYEAIRAIRAF